MGWKKTKSRNEKVEQNETHTHFVLVSQRIPIFKAKHIGSYKNKSIQYRNDKTITRIYTLKYKERKFNLEYHAACTEWNHHFHLMQLVAKKSNIPYNFDNQHSDKVSAVNGPNSEFMATICSSPRPLHVIQISPICLEKHF